MKDQTSAPSGDTQSRIRNREAAERALHQVLVTAVKHSALEAFVEMRGENCSALFRFEDRAPINVDLDCSPEQFVGAVLHHSLLTGREGTATLGIGRVVTKSCSVEFHIRARTGQDHVLRSSVGLASASIRRSIALTDFQVDVPGNSVFWLALGEDASTLHTVLSAQTGILVVASSRHAARNYAISAIRELYPHAETIPLVSGSFSGSTSGGHLIERAKEHLIIVGVDDDSDLSFLARIASEPLETRALINGIFALRMIPRNCPFCVVDAVPSQQLVQHHQQLTGRLPGRTVKGKGCDVCGHHGVVGRVNVSTLLDLERCEEASASVGGPGARFRSGASVTDIFDSLALATHGHYHSLADRGAQAVAGGSISLERFSEHLDAPLAEFLQAQSRRGGRPSGIGPGNSLGLSTGGSKAIIIEGDFFFFPATPRSKDSKEESRNVEASTKAASVIPIESARSHEGKHIAPQPRETGRVLVVHPDPEQRGQLGSEFELCGYDVDRASSSIEGMLLALKHAPVAIVLGVDQSDAQHTGLLRQLREHERTKQIPILALVKSTDFEQETELLTSGVSDVTSVEIPKELLHRRLKRLIDALKSS